MKIPFKKNKSAKEEDTRRSPATYRYHAVRMRSSDKTERRPGVESLIKNNAHADSRDRFITIFFIVAITIILGYMLWLNARPRIRIASDARQSVLLKEESEYESIVKDIIDNSILSQTKITINTSDISRQIEAKLPEVDAAVITIPLSSHRPIVDIIGKSPKLLLINNAETYVIDDNGYSISKLSELTPDALNKLAGLPIIKDETNVPIELGNRTITSETSLFIEQLAYQYKQKSVAIQEMTLPANKPNEIRVKSSTDNYYVKYVTIRPAREQFGAYQAVSKRLTEQGISPVEYVDVRVQEKVYYK